jgi:hypothetical protein
MASRSSKQEIMRAIRERVRGGQPAPARDPAHQPVGTADQGGM